MGTGADAKADQGQMLQSSTHGYIAAWPALPGMAGANEGIRHAFHTAKWINCP